LPGCLLIYPPYTPDPEAEDGAVDDEKEEKK